MTTNGEWMRRRDDAIPPGVGTAHPGVFAERAKNAEIWDVEGHRFIPIRPALRLYTAGGAAMNFRENALGRIAPGMFADLVIIDRDLLSAAPEDILPAQVDLIILAGRIVFDRAAAAPAPATARP